MAREKRKKEKYIYLPNSETVKWRIFRKENDDQLYSAFEWLTF